MVGRLEESDEGEMTSRPFDKKERDTAAADEGQRLSGRNERSLTGTLGIDAPCAEPTVHLEDTSWDRDSDGDLTSLDHDSSMDMDTTAYDTYDRVE